MRGGARGCSFPTCMHMACPLSQSHLSPPKGLWSIIVVIIKVYICCAECKDYSQKILNRSQRAQGRTDMCFFVVRHAHAWLIRRATLICLELSYRQRGTPPVPPCNQPAVVVTVCKNKPTKPNCLQLNSNSSDHTRMPACYCLLQCYCLPATASARDPVGIRIRIMVGK